MSKQLLRFRVAFMLVGSMLLAVLGGSKVIAQGVTTSSINGIITDDKGAALPGATVVAVHTPSGTRYGITTNNAGRYSFPAVRIGGPYRITVSFVGFQDQTREIADAGLGTPVQANFTLAEEGKALSEVVVTSQRGGIIDSERTGASTNIKRETFERMPSLNRSFTDFSSITPQAGPGFSFGGRSNLYNNFSIDGATSNNVFGLSATPGGQTNAQPISIDAIQELSVQLAPYDVSQGSFTGAGVNAVTRSGTNEFQGSVYAFTKSQALVNKKVEGVDSPIANFKYNNVGFRLGGPLIKNKLFFFVNGEYEKSTTPAVVYPADGTGNQQTSSELNRLRDFLVTPNNGKSWTFDPGTYGQFDVPIQSVKFLAKIDWNISDQHKFTIRYNQLNSYRDQQISNSGGIGSSPNGGRQNSVNALPFSKSWYRQYNNLQNVIAELNSTFGKGKFANNLQVGYSAFRDYRESGGGGTPDAFPTVDILGPNGNTLTTFGPDPFTPNNRLNQDIYQLNDKFDIFLGNHTVTLGTANEFYKFYNAFTQQINGVYQYSSIDQFIANATNPSAANAPTQYLLQYSALPGVAAPAADWKANQLGFYAQDVYSGIKNFRLTLGLRVDIPTYPNRSSYQSNKYTDSLSNLPTGSSFANGEKIYVNQLPKTTPLWSPRVGFNWDIFGDKSLQLRGGTGVFTGRVPFVWISNQLSNNGVFFGTISATNTGTGASSTTSYPFNPSPTAYVPALDASRVGVPLGSTFSINTTAENFKFPQVWRSSIALDKTLPGGFVGTLEAIYTKDINAIYLRDANMAGPVGTLAGDGRPLYGAASGVATVAPPNDIRLNDRVIQALVLDNTNKGYALSLTAQIQKTTGRLNGSLAYTYSDSKDISSQQGSTASGIYTGNPIVNDPNYPALSYANNWFPHRVNGFVSYRLDYLKSFASTFSFIYEGRNASNFSYTYNGNPNSDGTSRISGNDLIYIPRNQNEILLTPTNAADTRTPQQIWDQLNNYINQDAYLSKHRGEYAARNGALAPWFNSLNFRFLQDFHINVGGKRNTLQFSYEIINVFNLLNSNWGLIKTPARSSILNFVGYETPHTNTAPTTGRPIYTFATTTVNGQVVPLTNTYVNNVTINGPTVNSRWQMQLGLRYIFN